MIRVDEETGLGVVGGDRLQRPVRQARPVRRRAAGARRGLPQRRHRRRARRSPSRDCLNFGSPEDPDVMWQFAEACRGLKDGCLELGIPVTGGNVSLYNQTGETAILPTPVVAVLGVMEDVRRRTPSALRRRGRAGLPAGRDPRRALRLGVGARRARPPRRAAAGRRPAGRARAGVAAARRVGLLTSAHDLSDGGLAQALAEAALRNGVGVTSGPSRTTRSSQLFSESAARCAGHRAARRRRRPRGDGRRPRRAAAPRSAPPAATRSPSRAPSRSRSTSCAPPGPDPARRAG